MAKLPAGIIESMVEAIMASSLIQKLQIKPGTAIDIFNAPEDQKSRLIQEFTQNPVQFDPAEKGGAAIIFLRNGSEVDTIVLPWLKKLDGLFPVWLAYPKGTSGIVTDINRDILWRMLEPNGWGPARMIALDEVWSCMRFTRRSNG